LFVEVDFRQEISEILLQLLDFFHGNRGFDATKLKIYSRLGNFGAKFVVFNLLTRDCETAGLRDSTAVIADSIRKSKIRRCGASQSPKANESLFLLRRWRMPLRHDDEGMESRIPV
jgi:hypothetical protein